MHSTHSKQVRIQVDLARQVLTVLRPGMEPIIFPVSTASKGAGELAGSFQTPRGEHFIRACIGRGLPSGAVLVGRRPSGEIYTEEFARQYPERDWVLSRILWLCGEQPGFNRLGPVDSMRRYIYIHGTPDSEAMGIPRSHGCIRMRNEDVIALYSMVEPGTRVTISEGTV
ncbi:MAG: L,D-transpeptidase [Gammaproteobacteria bacterium]|nr:L,D-transpeptidase [Gammaproteobacteria bacterium]